MPTPPDSRLSAAEFALRLDEAKTRAKALRDQAIRDFGASLPGLFAAAARRLAGTVRRVRPARLATRPASHAPR